MNEQDQEKDFAKPPDLLCAKITDAGDIECPHCGTNIITPFGLNPYNRNQEKMIVHGGHRSSCKICRKWFILTYFAAKQHNRFWFPDDPTYN